MGRIKGQKKNEKLRVENGKCAGVRPGAGRKKADARFTEIDVRIMSVLSLIASRASGGVTGALVGDGGNPHGCLVSALKEVGEIHAEISCEIIERLKANLKKKGGAK